MANALKEAPSKKRKRDEDDEFLPEFQFDANKKYMFQLAAENMEREQPVIDMVTKRAIAHKKFKPVQNIVLTSQIVWEGSRRTLRYYDGCTSLFTDEQPKDKETIDALIAQTNKDKYKFLDGKFGAFGDERMLLIYLSICSWNAESQFRTRTADAIFVPLDKLKKATSEEAQLDLIDTARGYAKDASDKKMRIHANYLGIATIDFDSGNELSEKEIRVEYRKRAISDASKFIESYTDQKIEIKYYIDKALETGLINNHQNSNRAAWKSGAEICDISGIRSNEAISAKLFEFSQTEEGEEMVTQLKAIYN